MSWSSAARLTPDRIAELRSDAQHGSIPRTNTRGEPPSRRTRLGTRLAMTAMRCLRMIDRNRPRRPLLPTSQQPDSCITRRVGDTGATS
jgi:hypothetical protein